MALASFFEIPRRAARRAGNSVSMNSNINNHVEGAYLAASPGERIVTAVAVSVAVLVVTLIAVLMASVGP